MKVLLAWGIIFVAAECLMNGREDDPTMSLLLAVMRGLVSWKQYFFQLKGQVLMIEILQLEGMDSWLLNMYIYICSYIYISYRFTQRNILNHFSTWSYTPSVRNPVFVSKISNSVASGLYPRFLPTALLAPTSDCLFFQKQGVCAIRWLLGSAIPHPRVTSQRFSLNARLFWYLFSRPETRGKSHEVISSHILL